MKLYSLREHEPAEIRNDPAVIRARHELAADSQSLAWLRHPIRHARVMRHYMTVRFKAEERLVPPDAEPYPPLELEGAVPEEPPDSLPDPMPPYDWKADGVFGDGSGGGEPRNEVGVVGGEPVDVIGPMPDDFTGLGYQTGDTLVRYPDGEIGAVRRAKIAPLTE